jgi:hypothetical protein
MDAWAAHERREAVRYRDGLARLPKDADARQRQLVRVANAASGAGLACLMDGRANEARLWFRRAAERYRQSYEGAPPDSFGRLIGSIKMRVLAQDREGLADDARWALSLAPGASESPIGRYAGVLARLGLGEDEAAFELARSLRGEPEERFPGAVADAVAGLAGADRELYADGLARTLRSFEERDAYLEDIPVADTVLVLEALAAARGLAVHPRSALLP